MPKVLLYYFPLYGRAEVIAQLLSYAKVEWEFIPIDKDSLKKYQEEGKSEFGQAPFAEIDGKFYSQTDSILRLLGRKHGLYPQEPEVAFEVDSAIDAHKDLVSAMIAVHFEQDMEKKK